MRAGLPTVLGVVVIAGALGILGLCLAVGQRWTPGKNETAGLVPAGDRGAVRVLTANIRYPDSDDGQNAWPNRREFLVKTLLKYAPDVIGCQEVTPAQGAYLIKELGKWYQHYPRAGVGKQPAEGDLKAAVNQTFAALNTIFYRADRFEIVDAEAGLVLPEQLQQDATENTFYSLVILKEKQEAGSKKQEGAEIPWIVVNTHLRHREAFAEKCVVSIRAKINESLKDYPDGRVVLMGDMNAQRGSKVYSMLVGVEQRDGAGVLADSFDYRKKAREAWGTWHAFMGKPQAEWPSDLIFTGEGVSATAAEILRDKDATGRYPSDHFLVMTELRTK